MTTKSQASATVQKREQARKRGPAALWAFNVQARPEPTLRPAPRSRRA